MAFSTTLTPTPAAGKGIRFTWFTQLLENINLLNGSASGVGATAYTPTWASTGGTPVTVGNATVTGQYRKFGKFVLLDIKFTFGSTSADGAGNEFTFSLPSTAAATTFGAFKVLMVDAATAYYTGTGFLSTTTTIKWARDGATQAVGADAPIALATGDTISIQGWYLEA